MVTLRRDISTIDNSVDCPHGEMTDYDRPTITNTW